MTTKTTVKRKRTPKPPEEQLDATAVLKAADEIAQLEAQLKAKKTAMKGATDKALKSRRKAITEVLKLKDFPSNGWRNDDYKKTERRYILDQIAKAHAAGRLSIPGLD